MEREALNLPPKHVPVQLWHLVPSWTYQVHFCRENRTPVQAVGIHTAPEGGPLKNPGSQGAPQSCGTPHGYLMPWGQTPQNIHPVYGSQHPSLYAQMTLIVS